jgi:hypothetical protein
MYLILGLALVPCGFPGELQNQHVAIVEICWNLVRRIYSMNEVIRQQELISYDRIPDLAGL